MLDSLEVNEYLVKAKLWGEKLHARRAILFKETDSRGRTVAEG